MQTGQAVHCGPLLPHGAAAWVLATGISQNQNRLSQMRSEAPDTRNVVSALQLAHDTIKRPLLFG